MPRIYKANGLWQCAVGWSCKDYYNWAALGWCDERNKGIYNV